MDSLGRKIRNLRKERKMTQWVLANGLATASMISQIESDKATPSQQLLDQLAARLGVKPSYFAEDISQKSDLMQTYRRAKQLLEGENFPAALPLFLSLINPVPPQFREAQLFSDLAQCYEHLGQYPEASDMYEEVVRASLEKDDVANAIQAYYRLGQLQRRQNHLGVARMHWQRAAELLRRHHELAMPLAMRIYANLGRIHMQLHEGELALESYGSAAALANKYAAQLDLAIILHGMGTAYIDLGDFENGTQKLDEAIKLYDVIRHQRGINQCYVNIGVALSRAGKYTEALEHFTWCIHHPEIQIDVIRLANAFSERAACYLALGQYSEAEQDAKEAVAVDRDTTDIQAAARRTLSLAYFHQQRFEEANLVAEEGLLYAKRLDDLALCAELHSVRARALWTLGRYQESAESTREIVVVAGV